MSLFSCSCLNIKLHAIACEGISVESLTSNCASLRAALQKPDQWKKICLDLGAVSVEEPTLQHEEIFGEWSLISCTNCETVTFAVSPDKIYLSSLELLKDSSMIDSIKASPDFSPIFGLLLYPTTEDFLSHSFLLENTEYLDMKTVQERIAQKELVGRQNEVAAMQQRIDAFRENEKSRLENFLKQTERHKEILLNSIKKFARKKLQDKIQDAFLDPIQVIPCDNNPKESLPISTKSDLISDTAKTKAPTTLSASLHLIESASSASISVVTNSNILPPSPFTESRLVSVVSLENKFHSSQSQTLFQLSKDKPIFEMDHDDDFPGFSETFENFRPFIEDSAQFEDDDAKFSSSDQSFDEIQSHQTYSTSAPLEIPLSKVGPPIREDFVDKLKSENIAKSIQQISSLIHQSPFGDRPRRRKITLA